jgi:hypothetical protein
VTSRDNRKGRLAIGRLLSLVSERTNRGVVFTRTPPENFLSSYDPFLLVAVV